MLAVQSWIACAFYLFILFPPTRFCACRRRRSRAATSTRFAGHRPRHPSAAALSRLCRLLDRVLLCHCRFDRRPHRCRVGALGAAMDAGGLDVSHRRHRDGLVLGLFSKLGWGGFWFWDPVENASLMPWLAGTALLHSAVVMEKRNALKIWTLLLAIVAFSLSLIRSRTFRHSPSVRQRQ